MVTLKNTDRFMMAENNAKVPFGEVRSSSVFKQENTTLVTTTYIITIANEAIICNSITPFTVTLPVSDGKGNNFCIKNINTGTVTLDGNGSDTIDGVTTQNIYQNESISVLDFGIGTWCIV